MPIYEYQCKNCGQFEVMQRITDRRLTRCPKCEGKVTKLISNTSFQLKGSGWYATDYGHKSTGSNNGGKHKESKPDTSSATPTADKSEAKPDSKTSKSAESATT